MIKQRPVKWKTPDFIKYFNSFNPYTMDAICTQCRCHLPTRSDMLCDECRQDRDEAEYECDKEQRALELKKMEDVEYPII